MKRFSAFIFILFSVSLSVFGQEIVKTKNGKQVVLNANGTWKYVMKEEADTMSMYLSKFKKFTLIYNNTFFKLKEFENTSDFDANIQILDGSTQISLKEYVTEINIDTAKETIIGTYGGYGEILNLKSYIRNINGLNFVCNEFDLSYKGNKPHYLILKYSSPNDSFYFVSYSMYKKENLVDDIIQSIKKIN